MIQESLPVLRSMTLTIFAKSPLPYKETYSQTPGVGVQTSLFPTGASASHKWINMTYLFRTKPPHSGPANHCASPPFPRVGPQPHIRGNTFSTLNSRCLHVPLSEAQVYYYTVTELSNPEERCSIECVAWNHPLCIYQRTWTMPVLSMGSSPSLLIQSHYPEGSVWMVPTGSQMPVDGKTIAIFNFPSDHMTLVTRSWK